MTNNNKLYEIFKEKLTHYENQGLGYPAFAGLELIYGLTDSDVTPDCGILPEAGDAVAYNKRENGGYIGLGHESSEIWPIELPTTSSRYGLYPNTPQNDLYINSEFLWHRYICLSNLFSVMDTHEEYDIHINIGFKAPSDVANEFNKDVNYLNDDTHLCLYWLIVFGFLNYREHFEQVLMKAPTEDSLIQECVGFFKCFKVGEDIDLSDPSMPDDEKAFFKTAFRKRHAYLIKTLSNK